MVRKSLDEYSPASEEATAHSGRSSTAKPLKTLLLLCATLVPVLGASGVLYRQILPFPYGDDYDAILAFAVDYVQLPDARTKAVAIATKPHNEYKLGFEHAIVAAELELTHHLNFTFLITLGNLFLLPIGYLLWLTYRNDECGPDRALLDFLPISLCFFSLTYWENLNWAMTGLQNTPVILFSLLAIYFVVSGDRTRLLLGCLAAGLAAFTSANGFLLAPVGLLILLPRRAYAACLVWCAGFALPLTAYLYHHSPSTYVMHRLFYITRPLFFLGFLGAVVPYPRAQPLLGLMVLAVVFLAIRSRFDRINPTGFYFTVWLVATACVVAWVRGATTFRIASRYSLYSSLLLVFCYAFLLQYLPSRTSALNRRRFYWIALVLAGVSCLSADLRASRKLGERDRLVLSGIELYRARPDVNTSTAGPGGDDTAPGEKAHERDMLTRAIQRQIYALPPTQQIR
jgi:hypothetical protein